MRKELRRIKNKLNPYKFSIELKDDFLSIGHLNFIRISDFDKLHQEIHNSFNSTKSVSKQKILLKRDNEVYKELLEYLKKLTDGIKTGKSEIIISINQNEKQSINDSISQLFELDKSLNLKEKVKKIILSRLKKQLKETENRIFELTNYEFATYKKEKYLGRNFNLRFSKEVVIYKDVSIGNTSYGSSVLYKDETHLSDVTALINILAFLQASPNFILTESKYYNEKLNILYSEFDILDLLTLSSNKFFKTSKEPFLSLSTPILKLHRNTDYTVIPDINHLELFHLYHSSLKQFEPLPRCVFLFRIVEYGKNYHYNKLFNPHEIEWKNVIEYYYDKAINHRFIPLYFLDYGTTWDPKQDKMIKKRKTQYRNLLTELKVKSKRIISYWDKHSYLKSKSLGEIIYNTGRNTVAHGGNGKQNINYDYSNKYKHINDVNIFLELIARYIIEINNPELRKIVNHKKDIYEKNCSHLNMKKDVVIN